MQLKLPALNRLFKMFYESLIVPTFNRYTIDKKKRKHTTTKKSLIHKARQ